MLHLCSRIYTMPKCEVLYLCNLVYTTLLQNTADFSFLSLLYSIFHSLFFFFPYGNHLCSDPVIPVSDRDSCVKLLQSITNISPDEWCDIPPDLLTLMSQGNWLLVDPVCLQCLYVILCYNAHLFPWTRRYPQIHAPILLCPPKYF